MVGAAGTLEALGGPKATRRSDGPARRGVERLHALWLIAREHDASVKHPIAALVDAWQGTLPLGLDRATPREPEQGYLPGLAPSPSLVPPVPWLTLYDPTGSGPVGGCCPASSGIWPR